MAFKEEQSASRTETAHLSNTQSTHTPLKAWNKPSLTELDLQSTETDLFGGGTDAASLSQGNAAPTGS